MAPFPHTHTTVEPPARARYSLGLAHSASTLRLDTSESMVTAVGAVHGTHELIGTWKGSSTAVRVFCYV